MKYLATIAIFFAAIAAFAARDATDSLSEIARNSPSDTARVRAYLELSRRTLNENLEKSFQTALEALRIAERAGWVEGVIDSYSDAAMRYLAKGDADSATIFLNKALAFAKKSGDEKRIADVECNIGVVYFNKGEYNQALENYLDCEKLYSKIGDKLSLARVYNNIGAAYQELGKYDSALNFFLKGLDLYEELSDSAYAAALYNNIGVIYDRRQDYDNALESYEKSLEINKKLGKNKDIARNFNNIGIILQRLGRFDKAARNYEKSVALRLKIGDSVGVFYPYVNLAEINFENERYDKSLYYAKKAYAVGENFSLPKARLAAAKILAKTYAATRNYKLAFEFAVIESRLKDSLFNSEDVEEATRIEMQSEFDRLSRIRELEEKRREIAAKAEIEKQRNLTFLLVQAIVFILIVAILLYRNYRSKRKTAELLEQKNSEITDRNIEITRKNRKIQQAYENVKSLSQIGMDIAAHLKVEDIVETVYENVASLMNSNVFGVGIYNPEKNRLEFKGAKEKGETLPFFTYDLDDDSRLAVWCFKNQKEVHISDYGDEFKNFALDMPPPVAGEVTSSMLYYPLTVKGNRVGVITAQSFEKNAYTDYHVDILRNLALYASVALENAEAYDQIDRIKKKIEKQNVELERQKEEILAQTDELQRANDIISEKNRNLTKLNDIKDKYLRYINAELARAEEHVKSLLPKPLDDDRVKTDWFFKPSAQLGGDAFGYHYLDENRFAAYLLDVSGHGVGPALHSVSVLNVLRFQSLPDADFASPSSVLKALNKAFQMEDHNEMFLTIWYGVYDFRTRKLLYGGAGHPYPLLVDSNGAARELRSRNMMIGGLRVYNYRSEEIEVKPGSHIFVFSDGAYEIEFEDETSGKLKLMKLEELHELILQLRKKRNFSLEKVYERVKSLTKMNILKDDFSLMDLKIKK